MALSTKIMGYPLGMALGVGSITVQRRRRSLRARGKALVAMLVLLGGGCATAPPPIAAITLRETDMPRSLPADQTEHYQCEGGVLVCRGSAGRIDERACGCAR